jgi:hypothetical protein
MQPTVEDTPIILPCSVCSSLLSKQQEDDLFALEHRLSEIATKFKNDAARTFGPKLHAGQRVTPPEMDQFLATSLQPYPLYHEKSSPISAGVCSSWRLVGDSQKVLESAAAFALPFDNMAQFPNQVLSLQLFEIADAYQASGTVEGLQLAKSYAQRAVRMQLLIEGRGLRFAKFDNKLLEILTAMSSPEPSVCECVFCGERPETAAVRLSRCGKCKAVTYCSPGCQKLHWKLHKTMCKC